MRIFVTGATGFVGSAVVRELIDAGHQVLGLARSDSAATALAAAGIAVHRGDLDDPDSLRAGAAAADGVIHTAFTNISATTDFAAACRADLRAIEAFGEALAGSGKPLVVTSGTGLAPSGRPVTEQDDPDPESPLAARGANEAVVLALAERGVRASVLRLPPTVHGEGDARGFIASLVGVAREKGAAAYVGDGSNRWAAVNRIDAARLFRLAVESAPAGSRLQAVDDEGVAMRDIVEVMGRHLDLPVVSLAPEQAEEHFGWLAHFAAFDNAASSALTRELLGWQPTHTSLIPDLEAGHYFKQ